MTSPRFVQIHFLTSYPAALLNRDDAGLAKRLPFGGVTRTRISSQCLKRHWRTVEDEWALRSIGVPMAVARVGSSIARWSVADRRTGIDASIAQAVGEVFLKQLFQESAARKRRRRSGGDRSRDRPGRALRRAGDRLAPRAGARLLSGADDRQGGEGRSGSALQGTRRQSNLAAMKHHAGLDAALFGRMVTSDPIANTDAAIHVAHAFTVHEEESESDYFTVVDDLQGPGRRRRRRQRRHLRHGADERALLRLRRGRRAGLVPISDGDATLAGPSRRAPDPSRRHRLARRQARLDGALRLGAAGAGRDRLAPAAHARQRLPRSRAAGPPRRHARGRRRGDGRASDPARRAPTVPRSTRRFLAVEPAELPVAERVSLDDLAAWAEAVGRRRERRRVTRHLVLRLEAPLLSFGGEAIDNFGVVDDFPGRVHAHGPSRQCARLAARARCRRASASAGSSRLRRPARSRRPTTD